MARMYNPPHPGELLREYLSGVKVGDAAKRLRVARSTLSRLLNGRGSFTAPMALRLSDALGTEPEVWLDLQQQYDLWRASRVRRPKVERILLSGSARNAAA
jgi:addiction module HigA family antidote